MVLWCVSWCVYVCHGACACVVCLCACVPHCVCHCQHLCVSLPPLHMWVCVCVPLCVCVCVHVCVHVSVCFECVFVAMCLYVCVCVCVHVCCFCLPVIHWYMDSVTNDLKVNNISALSKLIPEMSLCTTRLSRCDLHDSFCVVLLLNVCTCWILRCAMLHDESLVNKSGIAPFKILFFLLLLSSL